MNVDTLSGPTACERGGVRGDALSASRRAGALIKFAREKRQLFLPGQSGPAGFDRAARASTLCERAEPLSPLREQPRLNWRGFQLHVRYRGRVIPSFVRVAFVATVARTTPTAGRAVSRTGHARSRDRARATPAVCSFFLVCSTARRGREAARREVVSLHDQRRPSPMYAKRAPPQIAS